MTKQMLTPENMEFVKRAREVAEKATDYSATE